MATSSKVRFNLETLKAKALESIDGQIARKQEEVDSFEDSDALERRVDEWRTRQESRVSDLFRGLGEGGVSDYELAKFQIEEMPSVDRYDIRRVQRDLDTLLSRRSKIVAKTDSLVPEEDGTIALTKTQLAEFFGL